MNVRTVWRSPFLSTFETDLNLFSQFKIPYHYFVEIEFAFAYKLHIPPSEIDKMFWYDVQYLYKRFAEQVEAENEESESATSLHEEMEDMYRQKMNSMKDYQAQMQNMPQIPNIPNMPNFEQALKGLNDLSY